VFAWLVGVAVCGGLITVWFGLSLFVLLLLLCLFAGLILLGLFACVVNVVA